MYISTITIKLKEAKGNPIGQDERIKESIERNIIGKMTSGLQDILDKTGIIADIETKCEWEE